jgi:cell division protein FtsQ
VSKVYRRKKPRGRFAMGERLMVRFAARTAAVMFLGASLTLGLFQGGHFTYPGSQWEKVPGKLASLVGLAADDIKITGLVHQEPQTLLTTIGVAPGGSLMGFDAAQAHRLLESLDWVASAKVQRLFPNQLEIAVTERDAFAVWQRSGSYYVIDRSGAAMSNIDPGSVPDLPLVTGEGAQIAAEELVNHLEAVPSLKSKVKAAAFVGERRWTLYLANGVTVALPETGVEAALQRLAALDKAQGLLSKGIRGVDLRIEGRMGVDIAGGAENTKLSLNR